MVKNFITPFASFDDLSIIDIGEENSAAIKYAKPSQRNHFIVHFIVDGKGVFRSTSATVQTETELTKNMAFAVFPSHTVFYQSSVEDPLYYFWFGFSGSSSIDIMNYLGFNDNITTTHIENMDEIISAFRSLFNSWQKRHDKYILISNFFKLITTIHKNSASHESNILLNNENEIFIKAEKFINEHLQDNIKIKDLTSALNIDRSYFSKIFKQRYQTTPHQYILKLRLKAAEKLLVTTNYSISYIVDKLHFTDRYTFTKQFKKKYKFAPLDYRKSFSKREVSTN